MGAKEAKPFCVSYEEAVKRVSEAELRRLREAFKKCSHPSSHMLPFNIFLKEVLFEGIPTDIANGLFVGCGGTQRGISFKDLLCGLVLLSRGTEEEKINFLWNLYCNDIGNKSETDFLRIEAAEPSLKMNVYQKRGHVTAFPDERNRFTYEEFKEWMESNRSSSIVSNWLLAKPAVKMSSLIEMPTLYQSLSGVTHLEEEEIADLEKVFWKLKSSSVHGELNLDMISTLTSPPIPNSALYGIFTAFDENRDGYIDFKEFCCGISAACRGPNVERTKFCFKVFDVDADGILNFNEISQMVDILLNAAKETDINNEEDILVEHVIDDMIKFTNKHLNRKECLNNVECSIKFPEFCLTQEDFMIWSVTSPRNLLEPFLSLLFEVCHIVFGLKPKCKHIERIIVSNWLSREKGRGYIVGQFWYLVASNWWRSWLQYTQNSSNTACLHCKQEDKYRNHRSCNSLVDEATFAELSLNDGFQSIRSSNSEIYSSCLTYERQNTEWPGPINNSNLVEPNIYDGVPCLTGEGGHLKRSTPLSEQYDFELIPETLWKALSRWYGDFLPLPRQVIQPHNSPYIEVELYPLNLRILRHDEVEQAKSQNATLWKVFPDFSSGQIKRIFAYTAAFSRLATVKEITEFLAKQVKLKPENIRLWHILDGINDTPDYSYLLEEEAMTLEELSVKDGNQILLEVRNKDLTWPEELGSLNPSKNNSMEEKRNSTIKNSIHALGATGLHNLGNTCFMNAALQILFNAKPLSLYFMNNVHTLELNTVSKLGTKGQLALCYGELLKEVWRTNSRSVAPLKLRYCVMKHAQQFAGGEQHDSQEFLEWFLDALHEDLNRVAQKPYVELKDSEGRADEIVAAEAWSYHNMRNQSIIIDLFYGQMKSKVNCSSCGRESVRFDPFSLLSLPIPIDNSVYCEILVILLDGSTPVKYGLLLKDNSNISQLKISLSNLCNINARYLLVCEVSNSEIKRVIHDHFKVSSSAVELVAYQLPSKKVGSQGCFRSSMTDEKVLKDIQRNSAWQESSSQTKKTETSSSAFISNTSPKFRKAETDAEKIKSIISLEREFDEDLKNAGSKTNSKAECDFGVPSKNFQRPENSFLEKDASTNSKNVFSECKNDTSKNVEIVEDTLTNNYCMDEPKDYVGEYLFAVHRKFMGQETYFLEYHKTRPSLFGIPFIVPYFTNGTNKDLYYAVWTQVNRLLSPLPVTSDQANHATDCDDSLGYNFPFILRIVARGGLVCGLCPWSNFCRGCPIPCNDDIFQQYDVCKQQKTENHRSYDEIILKQQMSNDNFIMIAIDWDPTALHLRYQSTREKVLIDHESVANCRRQQKEAIDLDYCLRTFTSEENLEQWYYCKYCKEKKPATKKLQIWKLPPILIVHLKRFSCANGKWVKSQKKVDFPFENFDPTPYLASTPKETIMRHKESSEKNSSLSILPNIGMAERPNSKDTIVDSYKIKKIVAGDSYFEQKTENENIQATKRECMPKIEESTKPLESPNASETFFDFHQHRLKNEGNPFELKYNLFAVVSHSGVLNGGHYISYAVNPNGSWYCFNDSSCREVSNKPNIDSSSTYLLLYERENLNYEAYFKRTEGMSLDYENADLNDINSDKKNCVIS